MIENKAAAETAENRYKIISPALSAIDEKADPAKLSQIKAEVCERSGISLRTLDRWILAHAKGGFNGLKPQQRTYRGPNAIPDELVEEAILLRREVPSRSVAQIIEILEMEGKAPAGGIKRTTLQDKMAARGYSSRQMRLYQQIGVASRRFARRERGDLWHADIKFVAYNNAQGKKQWAYLVIFLDDCTRYVLHGEFYGNLEQSIVEDCFRKAIIKEGAPRRVYFDRGKQFRNRWMERACAKLDIKLLFAKPYSPESTGKIERLNRTVDSFLAEAQLKKLSTLEEYNHYFNVWLQECYHSKKHGSIMDTPENAYKTSKTPLRYVPAETISDAFLHSENRKVDKTGCIRFAAKLYDVGIPLVGQVVEVVYDPADTQLLTVQHGPTGYVKQVRELAIGPHAGKRPKLPDAALVAPAATSRLLDQKEKRHMRRWDAVRHAISYSAIDAAGAAQQGLPAGEGGGRNV